MDVKNSARTPIRYPAASSSAGTPVSWQRPVMEVGLPETDQPEDALHLRLSASLP